MLFLIMIAGCSKEIVDVEDSSALVDDSGRGCETWLWYDDADSDYYGDAKYLYQGCDAPAGYVANPLDCDDQDPHAYPGAPELCDGLDTNCDGNTMDVGLATFFPEDGEPEPKVFDGSLITLDRSGTLNLCPWRHEGQLLITAPDVIVRGVWGQTLTFLDGGAKLEGTNREPTLSDVGSVVTVIGTNTVNAYITGLTIAGGNSTKGGGVYCGGEDDGLVLEGVVITQNVADYGGGLVANLGCHVQMYGVDITDNRARMSGGGIYMDTKASLFIDRLTVSNNTAEGLPDSFDGMGGGIYADNALITGETTLTVSENTASFMGGGVYLSGTSLDVPHIMIKTNTASFGGGLFMQESTLGKPEDLTESLTVIDNESTNGGGMILFGTSSVDAYSLLINGNTGDPGQGAWVDNDASLKWTTGGVYDIIYHGDLTWSSLGSGGGSCEKGICETATP